MGASVTTRIMWANKIGALRALKIGLANPTIPSGVPQFYSLIYIDLTAVKGPLSPLLANIILDDLDKELEKRGHRFVRYADDFIVLVKSRSAGERVKDQGLLSVKELWVHIHYPAAAR